MLYLLVNLCTLNNLYSTEQDSVPIFQLISKTNTLGNLYFYINNYGQIGYNDSLDRAGFLWRNDITESRKQAKVNYLFCTSPFFSAENKDSSGNFIKYIVSPFDLNENKKYTQPGRLEDIENSNPEKQEGIFFSTDYNTDGTAKKAGEADWPIRSLISNSWGKYVYDHTKRTETGAPVFISNEDIFVNYKTVSPLRLQFETTVYTWDTLSTKTGYSPFLADVMVLSTVVTNNSQDTLYNCSIGNIADPDITPANKLFLGTVNDNLKLVEYKSGQTTYKQDYVLLSYSENTDADEIDPNLKKNPKYAYLFGKSLYTSSIINKRVSQEEFDLKNEKNTIQFIKGNTLPANSGLISVLDDIYQQGDKSNPNLYNFIDTPNFLASKTPQDVRTFSSSQKFNLLPGESVRYVFLWGLTNSTDTTTLYPNPKKQDYNLVFQKIDAVYNYFNKSQTNIDTNPSDINISEVKLNIFPNPASQKLSVLLSCVIDNNHKDNFPYSYLENNLLKYDIYNQLGDRILNSSTNVYTIQEGNKHSSLQFEVELENLPQGEYFILIHNNQNDKEEFKQLDIKNYSNKFGTNIEKFIIVK